MDNKIEKKSFIEVMLGVALDVLPIFCACVIIGWAGRAYSEGYGLFVQTPLDQPGDAHSEMVMISEEAAGSALTVGGILEDMDLISNKYAFALKARLSGYSDTLLPGNYILSSDMTMEQMLEKLSVDPAEEAARKEAEEAAKAAEAEGGYTSEKLENKDVWGQ